MGLIERKRQKYSDGAPSRNFRPMILCHRALRVAKNATQPSISDIVSAFSWHYWNGVDEPTVVLRMVGTQPGAGDMALVILGDASCHGNP